MGYPQPYGGPSFPSSVANPAYDYFPPGSANSAQQCDLFTTSYVQLQIPWDDPTSDSQVVINVGSYQLFNNSQASGKQDVDMFAGLYSMLLSMHRRLQHNSDLNSGVTYELFPGDNPILDDSISTIELYLDDPPPNTSKWYGSTIIRRLGVMMWGYPVQAGDIQFINSKTMLLFPPFYGVSKGAIINLPPNQTGRCVVNPFPDYTLFPITVNYAQQGEEKLQLDGNSIPSQFP